MSEVLWEIRYPQPKLHRHLVPISSFGIKKQFLRLNSAVWKCSGGVWTLRAGSALCPCTEGIHEKEKIFSSTDGSALPSSPGSCRCRCHSPVPVPLSLDGTGASR